MKQSRAVHLVGSVTMSSAEEVFDAVGRIIDGRIARVPDGETGERAGWTWWQAERFRDDPRFEEGERASFGTYEDLVRVRVKPGVDDLTLDPPGYAQMAIESYATFAERKVVGALPADARFQVSVPTPLAFAGYIANEDRPRVEPEIEASMLRDLEELFAAIPHDQLAFQWDVCNEMVALEGFDHYGFDDVVAGCAERLRRLSDAVPADVELGWHFCYGNFGEQHFVEPKDMGLMVELANATLALGGRPVTYMHFPVPIARDDDAYFAPLDGLAADDDVQVFLGVLHLADGVAGATRRMATADRHRPGCGIAAECGLGRTAREEMEPTLELHAAAADAL